MRSAASAFELLRSYAHSRNQKLTGLASGRLIDRALTVAGIDKGKKTVAAMEFEPHELSVLTEACLTLDALELLQGVLDRDGPITTSSQGERVNPALPELRQQRITLARLLASLKIPGPDDVVKRGAPRGVYSAGLASA